MANSLHHSIIIEQITLIRVQKYAKKHIKYSKTIVAFDKTMDRKTSLNNHYVTKDNAIFL